MEALNDDRSATMGRPVLAVIDGTKASKTIGYANLI